MKKKKSAFTLIELLVVLAIIVLVATMLGAVTLNRGASDIDLAAGNLPDIFDQARAYAMAKSTYVFVGLAENPNQRQVEVAVVETTDGLGSDSNSLDEDRLEPITRLQTYPGVRLNTARALQNLEGEAVRANAVNIIQSAIRFSADVVTRRSDVPAFQQVVQFSPDGAARLDATSKALPAYIVLGLVPATGPADNSFCVLIDGPSGVPRLFRPGLERK